MSFDPNPIGPMMHLRQIERDVKQHCRFEQTARELLRQFEGQTATFSLWFASVAEFLAVPRTST